MTKPIRITAAELHSAQEDAGMWQQIAAIRHDTGAIEEDDCPSHAITVAQWCERFQVPERTARREIDKAVKAGKLECGRKRVVLKNGFPRLATVYWPAKP